MNAPTPLPRAREALVKQTRQGLKYGQQRQALDFAGSRAAQMHVLGAQSGFIQRMPIQARGLTYSYNLCQNE